jgi:biopolymer transport protein ExbB
MSSLAAPLLERTLLLAEGISFLLKGGLMMWPLAVCAVLSAVVMIERFFVLRTALRGSRDMLREVRDALADGRGDGARQFLEMQEGPVARILLTAVQNRDADRKRIESFIEEVAIEETPRLSKGLSILDTIITVAPLLGLLGTVTGMMKAFQVVAISSGLRAPTAITGGVAEALIATATGLAIAIVTLVGYNYLSDQVKTVVSEMEIAATKVINDINAR